MDIPADMPVAASSSQTEYNLVEITGRRCWLPMKAIVRMVAKAKLPTQQYNLYETIMGKGGYPNVNPRKAEAIHSISFEGYQKFEAAIKVSF